MKPTNGLPQIHGGDSRNETDEVVASKTNVTGDMISETESMLFVKTKPWAMS